MIIFLEDLKSYKAEEMSDKLMSKLESIVDDPMMEYETMVKKSSAAANLSSWVCNVYAYKRIYDNVKIGKIRQDLCRRNSLPALLSCVSSES